MHRDSYIPDDELPRYTAKGAKYLAKAIYNMAQDGGIPPNEMKSRGEQAILLSRKSLEMHTKFYGPNDATVASDLLILAGILDFFQGANNESFDEVVKLYQRVIPLYGRLQGSTCYNAAASVNNLGLAYRNRAGRDLAAGDVEQCVIHTQLSLTQFREATRIYRLLNDTELAVKAERDATVNEERLQWIANFGAAIAFPPFAGARR